jgi:transcriptional regulator of PTS gene
MVKGRPWIGVDGYSSELGHIPVFDDSVRCSCGKKAHSEGRLSIKGLYSDFISHREADSNNEEFSVQKLFQKAQTGDMISSTVVGRYADALGRIICVAAVALNIRCFVIGGGISGGLSLLKTNIYKVIDEYGFLPLTRNIQIRKSLLGNDAAVVGAGLFILTESANPEINSKG